MSGVPGIRDDRFDGVDPDAGWTDAWRDGRVAGRASADREPRRGRRWREWVIREPDAAAGDGNDIRAAAVDSGWRLEYSVGFGACPAGCICRHTWTFRVGDDGAVTFLESEGPLPPLVSGTVRAPGRTGAPPASGAPPGVEP